MTVVGYILDVAPRQNAPPFGQQQKDEILHRLLTDNGLFRILQDHLGFMEASFSFLLNHPATLASPQFRIQISDQSTDSIDTSALIAKYRAAGTRFVHDFSQTQNASLLRYESDIIRVSPDFKTDRKEEHWTRLLKEIDSTILATGVDTDATFSSFLSYGCTLFAGPFYLQPDHNDHRLLFSHLNLLSLVTEIQKGSTTAESIIRILDHDAGIHHKLCHLFHHLHPSDDHSDSIRALTNFHPVDELRILITALVLHAINLKTAETLRHALQRGRMCESLSDEFNCPPYRAFSAGLFSLVATMLNLESSDLLPMLPLDDEIRLAVLDHSGPAGRALVTTIRYENLDPATFQLVPDHLRLFDSYLDAINWSDEMTRLLENPTSLSTYQINRILDS